MNTASISKYAIQESRLGAAGGGGGGGGGGGAAGNIVRTETVC